MPEKQFISSLFAEKAKNDSNSQDLTNTLDILSKTVFGDVNRFIFELLQNADDSPSGPNLPVHVEFRLLENYLIFKHSGAHFSQNDILGISKVGSRSSEKDKDIEKTGYKGIGFKSIFGASDCVQIISDRYSFRFDKQYELWVNQQGYPWQVIPIWTDGPPIETENYIEGDKVNTIVSISDRNRIRKEIIETFNDTEIALFLRNVASITFIDQEKVAFKIEKRQISNVRRELWLNNKLQSSWIIKDFIVPIREDVKVQLNHLSDTECPQKLKDSTVAKITFAAQIKNDKILALESAAMYCYLPTKVKKGFPFVINADFITNAERTELLKNSWNTFLFEEIAARHIEWMSELGLTPLKFQTAKLIKRPFSYTSLELDKAYNSAFEIAIRQTAFIPSDTENLIRVSDALIDYTAYTRVFSSSSITGLLLQNKALVNSQTENCEILSAIGVSEFAIEDLCKKLCEYKYPNEQQAISEIIKLISFFKKQTEKNANWLEYLKTTNFLLSHDKHLCCASDIYYPFLQLNSNVFTFVQLRFLHQEVFTAVKADATTTKWLTSLGLKEPSEAEILRKTIFNYIESNLIESNIIVDLTKFIFKIFKAGKLQDSDYYYLQKLKIMSVNGVMPASECYLQSRYTPILKIDDILPDANFVSDVYIDDENELSIWKSFFIKLGVKQNISITVDPTRRVRSEYIQANPYLSDYFAWIDQNSFYDSIYAKYKNGNQHGVVNFSTVDYISYTVVHSFSKAFWQIILNNWQDFFDKCYEIEYYYYGGSVNPPSYVRYFLKTKACIPATNGNCYLPNQVYSKSLKTAVGDIFPVIDFEGRLTIEQYEFFGIRNYLTIENCLKIIDALTLKGPSSDLTKQLFAVYEQIIKTKGELKKQDIELINKWRSKGKFMVIDNSFQSIKDIFCFSVDGINPPVDSKFFIKFPSDFKAQEIELICSIFNIPAISLENLKCAVMDQVVDEELFRELNKKATYLAIVFAHRHSEDVNHVFNKLNLRINSITFYTCQKLSLKYETELNGVIFETKIETWSDKEDCFYFTGKWNSPITMYSLISSLCSFLQLKDMDKELQLILQANDETITQWLIEKGYKVVDTTIQEYDDSKHESQESVNAVDENVIKDIKLEVNVFQPRVKAAEVDISKVKIQHKTTANLVVDVQASTSVISDDKVKSDVGRWSEEFIYNYLIKENKPGTIIIWENQTQESYKPYDIKVIDGDIEQYIEVKGSPSATKQMIYLSIHEWKFMFEHKSNYSIYKVLNVGGEEADLRTEVVENPADKIEHGYMLPSQINLFI